MPEPGSGPASAPTFQAMVQCGALSMTCGRFAKLAHLENRHA
ncbi:hypothetical protein [Paraburkholderia sp. SIMBA_030]